MNITTQQVILRFLTKCIEYAETNTNDKMKPVFTNFFLKDELITIIQWLITPEEVNRENLKKSSTAELLAVIRNDANILKYYTNQLGIETYRNIPITNETVWKILEQTSRHNHYLASKDVATWDEYDHANYKSICFKAGKIHKVYALYDVCVEPKEAESVDSLPLRFYETKAQAKQALEESHFTEDDTHILSLFIGTP